jgi:hypothetical protein
MSQKRNEIRYRRRLKFEVGNTVLGYTVDVSAGGFQVEHLKPLPKGPLTGRLITPTGAYNFSGRLAWNMAGVPTAGIKSRSGVQLISVDPAFHAWLSQSAATT